MKTNHTALERVGMALAGLVLNTEKIIFWHTGRRLPLLRRFHACFSHECFGNWGE